MITYLKNGFIPAVCGLFSVSILSFLLGTEYYSIVTPGLVTILNIIVILLFAVTVWHLWYTAIYLRFKELKDKISANKDEYQTLMKDLQKEREQFEEFKKQQEEKQNGE